MRVIYVVFGGICILGGVVELVYVTKIGGLVSISFGVIVYSLSGIAQDLESLRERVATLEAAHDKVATPITRPPAPTAAPVGPTTEASPSEADAAKALLAEAEDYHFSKRFGEARAIYQQIIDRHGTTKQASVARQQLENLRGV